jgi:transcription initiation factor TFIIIB Brf1 subunit/transcription initiation factor TFIIB
MASPCCPKCLKKHFLRHNIHALSAGVIYCANCGTVVGAVPITKPGTKTTGGSGKGTNDNWESQV